MNLYLAFLLRNNVFTLLTFLGVIIFGVYTSVRLPVELMPSISIPVVSVVTEFSKGGASEIEQLITSKIEQAASTTEGLRKMRSVSVDMYGVTECFFTYGHNMDRAVLDLRKNIEAVKNDLPRDAAPPVLIRGSRDDLPLMTIAVKNQMFSSGDFEQEMRKSIRADILTTEGIGFVSFGGLPENEVIIALDPDLLKNASLSFQDVNEAVSQFNVSSPAGEVSRGEYSYSVRFDSRITGIDELMEIPVRGAGEMVRVKQVGTVSTGARPEEGYCSFNGERAVLIQCYIRSGANTIRAAKMLEHTIQNLSERYEDSILFTVVQDSSTHIKKSILNLLGAAGLGMIIGTAVLIYFYRSIIAALLVALSIPFSFILVGFGMYCAGYSINLLTLGGVALGVGMMLDGSIITCEKLMSAESRHCSRDDIISGIITSVQGVAGSIISSTITTIIVFLPVLLIKGLISTVFGQMAAVISLSLCASVLYSLTFLPSAVYTLSQTGLMPGIEKKIHTSGFSFAAVCIRYRVVKYGLCAVIVVFLFLGSGLSRELVPFSDTGLMIITCELPGGTVLADTERVERTLSSWLRQRKACRNVYAMTGLYNRQALPSYESVPSKTSAAIFYTYTDKKEFNAVTKYFQTIFRKENPHVITRIREDRPSFIRYFFSDLETGRKMLTAETRSGLEKLTEQYRTSRETRYAIEPYLETCIDAPLSAYYGIFHDQIAGELSAALTGMRTSRIMLNDESVPVAVRLASDKNVLFSKIGLRTGSGKFVGFDQIGKIMKKQREKILYRNDGQPVVYIYSDNAVPGQYLKLSDTEAELSDSVHELSGAFILSLIVIFIVISSQFNSVKIPCIILSSVLPGAACAFFFLLVSGRSLNIFSGIGFIILAGSSVNNAILIVESLEREKREMRKNPERNTKHEKRIRFENEGKDENYQVKDYRLRAVRSRITAVIITTATTVLGLLPVAVIPWSGGEYNADIATVLLGGIAGSYVVAAGLLPSFYPKE